MNKVNLKIYTNYWYKPGSKLKIILWYIINYFFFKTFFPWNQLVKRKVLVLFGATLGENVFIKPNVNIKYPWLLEIGNNVWIGENVWIDNLAKVTIGDNVCISQGALLLCGNHNYSITSFDLQLGEIFLEEGSWIGAKAIVCPGVKVHSHAILTVGSVSTKNLDAYSIYQGNPAQKVRDRKISD